MLHRSGQRAARVALRLASSARAEACFEAAGPAPPPPRFVQRPAAAAAASDAARALAAASARPPPLRPASLAVAPADAKEAALEAGDGVGWLHRLALSLGGFYSRESVRVRAGLRLSRAALAAADAPGLLPAAGLPGDDFRARFGLSSLHVWLLLVRLRAEGDAGKALGQELYDHFWVEQEQRVRDAGVVVRLSKWMKELEAAFYGSAASYDRALTPGAAAAALPGALRRNVYMGQEGAGGGDPERLARYVRHQLACLAATDSAALMAGHIRFVDHAAALPAASAAARGQ